jgi:hypothetical protein
VPNNPQHARKNQLEEPIDFAEEFRRLSNLQMDELDRNQALRQRILKQLDDVSCTSADHIDLSHVPKSRTLADAGSSVTGEIDGDRAAQAFEK